ncbi:MAG: DUF342 domain-containing protein [Sulfuricella sp.]|nr:DUF342 domain-containing protein [Sulfuricella sp.]
MQGEGECGKGLSYFVDEAKRKLSARFTPSAGKSGLDLGGLKRCLAESPFKTWYVNEFALADLIRKYHAASESFELEIGEARDGEFRIEISPDLMGVHLLLFSPQGGKPVAKAEVLAMLAQRGVVSGIIDENIETAIQCGSAEGIDIAKGRLPVHGEDGTLNLLAPQASERKPSLSEDGIANFRELGGVATVSPGAPLMRRSPPTPGEPGVNVLGHIVPPKAGKAAMFAPRLDGAAFAADDPDLLTAAIAGQPVLVNNGVQVDPVMTVENVDISSGNIHFEGTVVIRRDIQAGMVIEATGDIQVGGTVEAATLIAGGNVRVAGGVIGRHEGQKGAANAISSVRCGGSFHARFVQNARIEVDDSIYIDEGAMQSELLATRQIIVGKDDSQKGQLIGGKATATLLVKAQTLGAPTHVKTLVEVGVNPHLHAELLGIGKELENKALGRENVEKLLAFLKSNPQKGSPDVIAKAQKTHANLLEETTQLLAKQEELMRHISLAENARVIANRKVHIGARIQIGSRVCEVSEDLESVAYALRSDEIARDLLPRQGQAKAVLK